MVLSLTRPSVSSRIYPLEADRHGLSWIDYMIEFFDRTERVFSDDFSRVDRLIIYREFKKKSGTTTATWAKNKTNNTRQKAHVNM